MTDEELGELMRQCWNKYPGKLKFDTYKFGRLVAAAQREACARLCAESSWVIGQQFAKAIRARGKV